MTIKARRAVLAAAAVLAVAAVPAVATPATAAPAAPEMDGFDDSLRVPVGERATDTVTVRREGSVVVLQERGADGEWQTIRQFKTKGKALLTLKYPQAQLGQQHYRVVPVSTTPPEYGVPVKVTIIGFQREATLQGWAGGEVFARKGAKQARVLQASPVGATAQLQRRGAKSNRWTVVSSRKVRADGRLRVNPGPAVARTMKYRVVIPKQDTVGRRMVSDVRTVIGYGKVAPTAMLPTLLNRLVAPLGIPRVSSSSVSSPTTARASCVASELAGMGASRSQPGRKLRARLLGAESFRRAPAGMINGVNVSVRCQSAYFVRAGKVVRAVPVSTGRSGYRTDLGTFRMYRGVNGVETSQQFPDDHWNMYRSLYFNGGEAVHGSYSDSYVRTYPDSHGCVRMLHRDVDWLWRKGWTIGTTVKVYGSWA